jgi:hypothetical protein
MSGYGIAPGGYGNDPYGDPFVSVIGLLSASVYSMQPYLRANIETEISSLSVSEVGDMALDLTLSKDESLSEICLLSVDDIADENLLAVAEVN